MNPTLKFAALGEGLTGLGLAFTPSLVIRLVFGTTVEGVGIVACRLAGLALIGLGLACWPGVAEKHVRLGMLVYSLAAGIYLVGIGLGIGGATTGIMLWPAAVAHVAIALLMMRAWFGAAKPN